MSNSKIDLLRAKRSLSCVAYQNILKIVGSHPNNIIVLFEGEDEKYYSCRFSSSLDYSSVICNGKTKLLEANKLAKSNSILSKVKIYGFVDHDFDQTPIFRNIYTTPTYSIENLYCTESAFDRILRAEFGVCKTTESDLYEFLFNDIYKSFLKKAFSLKTLNSWLCFQRDTENQNGSKKKLNVNNIQIHKVLRHASKRETIKYLSATCPNAHKWALPKRSSYANHRIHKNPLIHYRGKWLLEIFIAELRRGIDLINKKTLPYTCPQKPTLSISGNVSPGASKCTG